VAFALRRECRPFCRDFHPCQTFAGAPFWAKFCGPAWLPVLAVTTGVGHSRAKRVLTWLLNKPKWGNVPYRPKLVLAAGFCGALQGNLKTGDLILASEVVDAATGTTWPTTWPGPLSEARWSPPLHQGRLVTVPNLAATPEQKRKLGHDWDALAVDMESAALARLCHESGVPFGCLRVVLDEAHALLSPRLVSLLSGGQVSPWRLAAAMVSGPRLIPELLTLAKRSDLAAEQLGKGLGEVLTLTLPWLQD